MYMLLSSVRDFTSKLSKGMESQTSACVGCVNVNGQYHYVNKSTKERISPDHDCLECPATVASQSPQSPSGCPCMPSTPL